jgi:chromosome segregation ATPase
MREELTRLRRTNMECEEEIARSRSELGKTSERARGLLSELEMKDQEVQNLGDLAGRRRQELLNVQAENDKLRGTLRALHESKDNTESQKLIINEAYLVASL